MYDIYIRRHGDRTGIVHADPSVVLELGGHSKYQISIWANMIYQLGRIVYHSFVSVSCCPCPSTAADPPGPPMSVPVCLGCWQKDESVALLLVVRRW